MVKIFTIVKDEVDIIKEWIIYHGCLFGWNNIYVIDNYSTDGTYEEIVKFSNLINIYREADYKKKGEFMTQLIRMHCNASNCIGFPIDIDEFVVYYEKDTNNISVDKEIINNYINNLSPARVYKANYLYPILRNKNGNENAVKELDYAQYCDMKEHAKSFVNVNYFKDTIDHGNHIPCNDYQLTNIHLVHYHHRNIEQIKKKILNNVQGFNYSTNLESLKRLIDENTN